MRIRVRLSLPPTAIIGFFGLLMIITNSRPNPSFIEHLSGNTYIVSEDTHTSFLRIPWLESSSPNDQYKNICVNKKDPSTMSTSEQLKEFISGPCLPVVIVPGYLGSRLKVQIDCETLQKENPEIFASCGWSTCTGYGLFGEKPKEEYKLWIADFMSPMSVIKASTVKCWANLVQLKFNKNETDMTRRFQSPKGATVTVYGETDASSNCGFEAINNLLPGPFQLAETKGFSVMKQAFEHMGYQVGLTLYATPYDWRRTTLANGVGTVLNKTLIQANELTGKPSVIIAHSLGNLGSLYVLNNMSPELKKKLVYNWVSLMNVFGGSPKSLLTYIGGNNEYDYSFLDMKFGVDYDGMAKLFRGSSGSFDLLPRDPFTYFKNESWFKEWESRLDLETEHDINTPEGIAALKEIVEKKKLPFSWFPSGLDQCFSGFTARRDQCGLMMSNWAKETLIKIKDEEFLGTEEHIKKLFDKYVSVTKDYSELFSESRSNKAHLLENPGVPVTLVYGSHLQTRRSFEWDYDPIETNKKTNSFVLPTKVNTTPGDFTVPTTSALLPAFKWAWEFDNKDKEGGNKNAQPIKTVEFCSSFKNKDTVYDDINDLDHPFTTNKNEYIGLSCECIPEAGETTDGSHCNHAEVLVDSHSIKFIQNIIIANYKGVDYSKTKAAQLNEGELDTLRNSCPMVDVGLEDYHGTFDHVEEPDDPVEMTKDLLDVLGVDLGTFFENLNLPGVDLSTFVQNLDLPGVDLSTFVENLDLPNVDLSAFAENLEYL